MRQLCLNLTFLNAHYSSFRSLIAVRYDCFINADIYCLTLIMFYSITIVLLAIVAMSTCCGSGFEPMQVICEINGYKVPAIVDTGAEVSVMSASCARRCGVSSSINTKFSGRALGVGSSEILGGIEELPIKLGAMNFFNNFSIIKNSRCDLLIGLDVLRKFQCEISMKRKNLKLFFKADSTEVPFLCRSKTPENHVGAIVANSNIDDVEDYVQSPDVDFSSFDDFDDDVYTDDPSISMEGV